MKTLKPKKCAIGKEIFQPIQPFQKTCFKHAGEWIKLQKAKKLERTQKEQRKVMKKNIETASDYIKKLQPIINHIARLIDYGQPCISCRKTTGKPQGGHYHSTNAHPALRFNLHVIHLQDFKCNVFDSANITGYNKGLIEVYGEDYQQYIEFDIVKEYPEIKLSIPELKEAIKNARNVLNVLKDAGHTYPNHVVRRGMREIYNKQIGIYPR